MAEGDIRLRSANTENVNFGEAQAGGGTPGGGDTPQAGVMQFFEWDGTALSELHFNDYVLGGYWDGTKLVD